MQKTTYSENIYTEVHHIIPKCLSGTNDKENLVRLTAREHIMAHLLLVRIYPDDIKILYAANRMTKTYTSGGRVGVLEKHFSTRTLARFREEFGLRTRGENNPNYGKKASEETKRKQSESRKGKLVGEKNPFAKKVQGPDGNVYGSLVGAAKELGISKSTLGRWIKNKPEKGYRFI